MCTFTEEMEAHLKYGHILLAVIVLINTAGVSINKHYCNERLKSVALFVPAPNCHSKQSHCDKSHNLQVSNTDVCCSKNLDARNCCNNQTVYLKSTIDFYYPTQDALIKKSIGSAVLPSCTYFSGDPAIYPLYGQYNYRPPPIVRLLPILFQNFRF